MNKIFLLELDKIQPSQLYLSKNKLNSTLKNFELKDLNSFEPIPIKILNQKYVATDGHHRAFILWQRGERKVRIEWEDEDLDWELYRICVKWCEEEGIFNISDLKDRIIDNEEYEELWLNRCKNMHERVSKEEI
ncbi:MAG: hypothetical protein KGD73_00350 [Candidatus Lokiarchaeota archaeon]|nr:hypothetical protein [Candidatus Lokiarchaeota archaeon]